MYHGHVYGWTFCWANSRNCQITKDSALWKQLQQIILNKINIFIPIICCVIILYFIQRLGTVLQSKPILCRMCQHFPGDSYGKESACNAGDPPGLIPESGRSLGEGNGNSLQYSCLENPMHRGGWWAAIHEVAKSWTQLSN